MKTKERLISAIESREVDHVPCSFMSFTALRKRCNDDFYKLAIMEKELGLDSMLFIPSAPRSERFNHPELRGLPVKFNSKIIIKEWQEKDNAGNEILKKEYKTPLGTIDTEIRQTGNWSFGKHSPFIADALVPRLKKPLISEDRDLEILKYILAPPDKYDIAEFQKEAKKAKVFVNNNDLLLVGGWGIGIDMAAWLCGIENLMMLIIDRPSFVEELLDIIHNWNLSRMEVVLSGGVDLFIRRAWYEGGQFVLPEFFENYISKIIKKEAHLVHNNNSLLGFICSSGVMPILDSLLKSEVDVLIGIDPIQGEGTDLEKIKKKLNNKICLWGGVSGAITVEQGSEKDIRFAVKNAIDTLGPEGFILSPIDNITIDSEKTWRNIEIFIDEWKKSFR